MQVQTFEYTHQDDAVKVMEYAWNHDHRLSGEMNLRPGNDGRWILEVISEEALRKSTVAVLSRRAVPTDGQIGGETAEAGESADKPSTDPDTELHEEPAPAGQPDTAAHPAAPELAPAPGEAPPRVAAPAKPGQISMF